MFSIVVPGEARAEVELRLHFAWGGGTARQWKGRVSLSSGRFADLQLLGVDADQPGSVQLSGQQILVRQKTPRAYDGFEVTARTTDGQLRLELLAEDELKAQVVTLALAELVEHGHSQELDSVGNRLVVRRVSSDSIPVHFENANLIFRPGAEWNLSFGGRYLGMPAQTGLRCQLQLRRTIDRKVVWEQEYRERADDAGDWPREQSVSIDLPTEEGVYDLVVAMLARRRTPPFRYDSIARRTVQLIVISAEPRLLLPTNEITFGQAPQSDRELVLEVDPSEANWWQRLTRLPQWTLLPGFRSDGPLANLPTEQVEWGGGSWTQMAVGGWQAYPLPLARGGTKHEIEFDFPTDRRQSLTVSIVEANAAGKVIPVGVDSAVDVTAPSSLQLAVRPAAIGTHRFAFWPKTRSPLLLVTNINPETPALYGGFKVYRHQSPQLTTNDSRATDRRQAIAFFERPLFPEAYGATESLDGETGRSLEDWQTFYDGATRMIEQVRGAGYRGVAVTCASEGSTIYPSPLWQPTPKHDRGMFFSSGQDPIRKDVLELLFQLCDREELKLIPTLEFASPLPALERQLLEPNQPPGIRLEDATGAARWLQAPARRGRAAYYNPLDPRVQQAMQDVVNEVLARYSGHRSFGGIAITLHADGYTQLPDVDWGADPTTWGRFCRDRNVAAAVDQMSAPLREDWLSWRCQQLGDFYKSMGNRVAEAQPQARLYLAGARLVESRPIQRAFRPTLPASADVTLAMRELGLDPRHWKSQANIVTLRPQYFEGLGDVQDSAASPEFNQSVYVDRYFRAAGNVSGSLFLHQPHLLRLSSFDDASPYGKKNTFMSLVAQVSQADFVNRERFAHGLARQDARVMFEGGWLLPTGQDESLRQFLRVFQQLPDLPFQSLEEGRAWQPLAVRAASDATSSYLYLVNDSPWHVGAVVHLDASPGTRFESLGEVQAEPVASEGSQTTWTAALEPYGFVAIRADRPNLGVLEVRANLPPDVQKALEEHILDLAGRAARLVDPSPMSDPDNRGFEQWQGAGGLLDGWSVQAQPGSVLREDEDMQQGRHAVRVRASQNVVQFVSRPINLPSSNRLTVSIRAKASDVRAQPRVRMMLRVNGTDKYPWAPIGGGISSRALSHDWSEFVFRVNQLPPIGDALQIGIQVDGQGEVLLDNLQLFDVVVLDDIERKSLTHMLARADRYRADGLVTDCLRILAGYWPQYLTRNVSLSMDEMVTQESPADATRDRPARPPERAATWWQRLGIPTRR